MAWFRNLPLRWKLLGAFGVILALGLGFSALAYQTSLRQERASREVERKLAALALVNDAYLSLVDMQTGYRGFMLTGDTSYLAPYVEGRDRYRAKLTELAAGDAAAGGESAHWQDVDRLALAWQQEITDPAIALRNEVNAGAASVDRVLEWAHVSGGKSQFDAIRAVFDTTLAADRIELNARIAEARTADAHFRATLIWGTLATIGLAAAVAVLLSRDIVGAVGRVATAAQEVGRGRLDHRVGLHRTDEIGQTAAVFDRMAGRLQQMIQELERAVAAARSSEARASAITDSVADGLFTFDERGVIASFNRAAERIFGYRPFDVIGQHVDLLLPPVDPAADGAADATAAPWSGAETVTGVSRQCLGRRADGALFPMALVVSDMRLAGQRQCIGVVRDVTDRQRAEAELARQYRDSARARGETAAVLDATNEAMVLVSPERRVLTVNRRFEELFGVEPHDVVGRQVDALAHHLDRAFADPAAVWRELAGSVADAERRFTRVVNQQWPEPRVLELTSAPVRDGTGEHLGRLFAYRDVTRERAGDRVKTEFASLVTHGDPRGGSTNGSRRREAGRG